MLRSGLNADCLMRREGLVVLTALVYVSSGRPSVHISPFHQELTCCVQVSLAPALIAIDVVLVPGRCFLRHIALVDIFLLRSD